MGNFLKIMVVLAAILLLPLGASAALAPPAALQVAVSLASCDPLTGVCARQNVAPDQQRSSGSDTAPCTGADLCGHACAIVLPSTQHGLQFNTRDQWSSSAFSPYGTYFPEQPRRPPRA